MNRRSKSIAAGCMVLAMLPGACGKSEDESEPVAVSSSAPAAVLAEIAAWKSVGGVTDARELGPKSTGGGRNAADLHRPLFALMSTMSPSDEAMVKEPWDTPVSSLKYVLESYERELATVREALALPYCDWELPYEQGMEMELPHLPYSRSAARLLVVEAIVRKDAGDYEGAAASVQDILRLSDQIATDPIAIVTAVRFSLDEMACAAVHQLFYEEGLEAAAGIRGTLAKRNHRADIRRALLGEGAIGIDVYRRAAGGSGGGPIERHAMSDAVADELVWYLKMTRSFAEQAPGPYYQMTALADAPRRPPGEVVEQRFTDPAQFDRMCRWAASAENYATVAGLALQLRERKEKDGAYPVAEDFKTPNDMLTGEPIGYDRLSDGFVLRFAHVDFDGDEVEAEWEW